MDLDNRKEYIKIKREDGTVGYVIDSQWNKIQKAQNSTNNTYEFNLLLNITELPNDEEELNYVRILVGSKNKFIKI